MSQVSLDAAGGQQRRRGGNRINVALLRSGPARCDIATVPARQLCDGRDGRQLPRSCGPPAAGGHPTTSATR